MGVKELPEGWVEVKISDIAIKCSQRKPDRGEQFFYVDISSINRDNKKIENPNIVLGENAPSRARKIINTNDILVSLTRPNLNAVALVDEKYDKQIASTGFEVIKPVQVDSKFIFALVRSQDFINTISGQVQGALYPAAKSSDVQSYSFSLPSLAEQQQISKLLDNHLTQVEQIQNSLNAIPKILEKFRQSVLADAVSGKLTEDWRGDSLTNNSNWQLIRLNDIAHWGSGGTPSRKIIEYYNGDIPWVKTGDLGKKYLNKTSENITVLGLKNSSAKIYPKGVVAIAMYGATIGKVSILNIQAATNQACAVAKAKQGITNSEYIYYFLLSQKDEFIRKGKGGAQPNISQTLIKEHPINLPPLPEQNEIVRRVEELFAFADQIEERVTQAQSRVNHLTQSILNQAFTGKLTEQWRADNIDLITGDNSAAALLASIESERQSSKAKKSSKRGSKAKKDKSP